MRKIDSWRGLAVGGIYNTVYVGDNAAYAEINGKQTVIILGLQPLQFQEMFGQFGDPFVGDIRDGTVTVRSPDEYFQDREVFQPDSDAEWFRKSVKLDSVAEAIRQNLLTKAYLEGLRLRNGFFCPRFDENGKLIGVFGGFPVDGVTAWPTLQKVFIVWKTWDVLFQDFQSVGITVK